MAIPLPDDPLMAGLRSSRAARPMTADEEEGLLSRMGRGFLTPVSKIGAFFDLPGSMIRDTLGGENPFDQFLSPLSWENRLEGRQLLERAGILGPNQEGFDAGDVAGFAGEVLLDPLTYFLPGSAALKPAGRAAKLAGLSDDVSRVASAKLGKDVGKRVGQMNVTLDDLITASPDPAKAMRDARRAAGGDDALSALRGETLGGGFGWGLPFSKPSYVAEGPLAERFAGGMDRLGRTLRYGQIPGTNFSPGQHVARILSKKAGGVSSVEAAPLAEQLERNIKGIRRGARANTALRALPHVLEGMDESTNALARMYAEDVLTPEMIGQMRPADRAKLQPLMEPIRATKLEQTRLRNLWESIGGRTEFHENYFPRTFVDAVQNRLNTMGRREYLENFDGMTESLRKIISDDELLKGSLSDATKVFNQKYGTLIKDLTPEKKSEVVEDLLLQIREKYTPEQRAAGGFGRNVFQDAEDYTIGMNTRIARHGSALDAIARFAKRPGEITGPPVKVGDLIEDLGLEPLKMVDDNPTGALVELRKRLPEMSVDEIRRMRVPEKFAKDIRTLAKGPQVARLEGPIVKAWDSFTNLFKAGVLTRPARYSRDFTSGQAMSILTGNWNAKSFGDARKLIAGETVDFTDVPAIQDMLKQRGMEMTAENSTNAMRELLYADELSSGRHGFQGGAEVVGPVSASRAGDLASEFPGLDPLQLSKPETMLDVGAPARSRAAWNPLNVRGVGDRLRTEFKPVAVGERVGKLSDELNRFTPYIVNLRRGAAPEVARDIANAIQVNYLPHAFTPQEREYLRRAFPFYSFTSSIVPEIIRQISSKPGGGLRQALRVSAKASDPGALVPDYVAETLSVPTGEGPQGDPRYLTGLGLMHEEPLGFLSGPGLESLSRLHPLLKMPLEQATGQTFFQRSPGGGGRPLEDLDPVLARTITNIRDSVTGEQTYRPDPLLGAPGGAGIEYIAANSPLAAWLTTARKLADPRKGPGEKSLNLLTGLRTTTVSEAQSDKILENRLDELMRKMGGRQWTQTYVPKHKQAQMSPEQLMELQRIKQLERLIDRRRKQRSQNR